MDTKNPRLLLRGTGLGKRPGLKSTLCVGPSSAL